MFSNRPKRDRIKPSITKIQLKKVPADHRNTLQADTGVSEHAGTGLGLASVHHRLTAFYGEGVKLRSFPFGTVVRLEVPVS